MHFSFRCSLLLLLLLLLVYGGWRKGAHDMDNIDNIVVVCCYGNVAYSDKLRTISQLAGR